MSILIKSNQVSSINFGPKDMLGTTPQAEFDKYKARVVADGGVIIDEARTLRAFETLFNTKTYGNIATFVSGSFGIKKDSNNHILKAYAINGFDMVGLSINGGELPMLSPSNEMHFLGNNMVNNAPCGILSTESRVLVSKTPNYAMLANVTEISADESYIAGVSFNDEIRNPFFISSLRAKYADNTYQVAHAVQKDPFNGNTSSNSAGTIRHTSTLGSMSGFHIDAITPVRKSVGNILSGAKTDPTQTFKQMNKEPFYINLGGLYLTEVTKTDNIKIRDFIMAGAISESQAIELCDFN